jgi:hypothetical protein
MTGNRTSSHSLGFDFPCGFQPDIFSLGKVQMARYVHQSDDPLGGKIQKIVQEKPAGTLFRKGSPISHG